MLAWSGFSRASGATGSTPTEEVEAPGGKRAVSQPVPQFGRGQAIEEKAQPMVAEYAFKTQWWKRLVVRYMELDRQLARGATLVGITLEDISCWSSRGLPPPSRVAEATSTLAGFTKGILAQTDGLSKRVRELEDKECFY